MELPTPAFEVGQFVTVILNADNRTSHAGIVRDMVWHYEKKCFYYPLEEDGKKVSKRYFEIDLRAL